MSVIAIVFVAASLLVAVLGKDRKFGFWGYFFYSLLFTPLLGIILLFASDKRKSDECD